jgi:hypothetical protein
MFNMAINLFTEHYSSSKIRRREPYFLGPPAISAAVFQSFRLETSRINHSTFCVITFSFVTLADPFSSRMKMVSTQLNVLRYTDSGLLHHSCNVFLLVSSSFLPVPSTYTRHFFAPFKRRKSHSSMPVLLSKLFLV